MAIFHRHYGAAGAGIILERGADSVARNAEWRQRKALDMRLPEMSCRTMAGW
jgi:hypothetical protein